MCVCSLSGRNMLTYTRGETTLFLTPLHSRQVECARPAGGAAQSFCGAGVSVQPDSGQPETHGSLLEDDEPPAGETRPSAQLLPPKPAFTQRYFLFSVH